MANPVNVSTASRPALHVSSLFSAEEIDAILDLRSSSGVLNWRFLCGVGSINQDRWMRLLWQNASCGQFEEDEGDEDDGQQQDDDAHLGVVGGGGVLNRESEEWQRMEERLDRMTGTAQDHERLLVAHSVSTDAQRNRLSDVIEFLAEIEVGDRNRMMDLLHRQCGMTSSVASPIANRQQNVLDWSMQQATWMDELSSASDASFPEFSPQGQDTIPLVVGSTARDGQSMGPNLMRIKVCSGDNQVHWGHKTTLPDQLAYQPLCLSQHCITHNNLGPVMLPREGLDKMHLRAMVVRNPLIWKLAMH